MTFHERQNRLTKLTFLLALLLIAPFLMDTLNLGELTGAGVALYCALLLAVAFPMVLTGVQHARALRHRESK